MISFLTRLKSKSKHVEDNDSSKSNKTTEEKEEKNLKQNSQKLSKPRETKKSGKPRTQNRCDSNESSTNNATPKSPKVKANGITPRKKKKTPDVKQPKKAKKKQAQKKPQNISSDKKSKSNLKETGKSKKDTQNMKKTNKKKTNKKNDKHTKNKSDKTAPKKKKKQPKEKPPKSPIESNKKSEPKTPVTNTKEKHIKNKSDKTPSKKKKKEPKKPTSKSPIESHKKPEPKTPVTKTKESKKQKKKTNSKHSKQSEKRNKKQKTNKKTDCIQSSRTKTKAEDIKTKTHKTTKQNTKDKKGQKKKEKKKKREKGKQRKSEQFQKDIETAKRRLSKRLSVKSTASASDMDHDQAKQKTDNTDVTDINRNIWSDYVYKFGNEPQNVSELQTFCKTHSKYSTLNYKQCKEIFDTHRINEPEDNIKDMKNRHQRDQNYIKRDIHSAKKRFNRRVSAKPQHVQNVNGKNKIPVTPLRDDASWIAHKEEKSSVDLIKDNIETQKRLYLEQMQQGDTHTVEKKQIVSSLFVKHMEIAKRNSMLMPNGILLPDGCASPDSLQDAISPRSVKIHQRLKDEKEAMKNAIDIVRDLGFLKYIKDNDVYSKIYNKRCVNHDDFDMFDMNNMDILCRFEEKTRRILNKVICKAIVSIPTLEIIEMCNADIDDNFMEIFIGYLLKYYHLNSINNDIDGDRSANICILSLQSNPISDRGMISLCRLIRRNYDVLHTVKLQNNRKDISTTVCEEICKSLEQNDYITKFEFLFRHYEWRDFRDKLIKRNAERARIMKLEIQRLRLILKVMESLQDDEFETFVASFGRSKLLSILFTGLLEEIKKDKIDNVNKMNAVIAQIRNDEM